MANKIYTVVKDGETVKELKTLAAAKKLADEEGAEVYCDGAVVYAASPIESATDETEIEEAVDEPTVQRPNPYLILAKMNIRKAPSLNADKLGIAEAGKVVMVTEVVDDWLYLKDGTFILYGGGKFAVKT